MEMEDEMELLFEEMGNDTILPTTLFSLHDQTWSDPHLSPISNSIFMTPAETHWSGDLMKGDLLMDTIQSFPDENKTGFDIHGFDAPLQELPPSSWGSPFSNIILDDSFVASFLEVLSPRMVSPGSPMESLSMSNSYDDLGCLVNLLQTPNDVSETSDLFWWDCANSTSGWTSDHLVGSTKIGGSYNVPGEGLNDQLSSPTKRRGLESSLTSSNMMKPSSFDSSDRNVNSGHARDCFKGNVNNQTSRDIVADVNKPAIGCAKTSRTMKKKTKSGFRYVPKDRMLTYACYAELRKLIPNGEKMSIDRVLHRTIKQLYFLQSVSKHAKGLAKYQLLKDIKDQKDNCKNVASGVMRACEIEYKMMICPLVVEDLSTPGQMLIRIFCQEQGFFLEIVDMIRGFGLNILKGCMEVHEAKIHAHYIVEVEENRFVSRHEIFTSLIHVLGLTNLSNEFTGDDLLGNVWQ